MGLKRIYLDTCIVIYTVEEQSPFAKNVEAAKRRQTETDDCYSYLGYFEALVKPIRTEDIQLRRLFELFFDEQELLGMPKEVFEAAAKLRADFPSLKTPDALHLTTAVYHNCDKFWTNDIRLSQIAPSIVKDVVHS